MGFWLYTTYLVYFHIQHHDQCFIRVHHYSLYFFYLLTHHIDKFICFPLKLLLLFFPDFLYLRHRQVNACHQLFIISAYSLLETLNSDSWLSFSFTKCLFLFFTLIFGTSFLSSSNPLSKLCNPPIFSPHPFLSSLLLLSTELGYVQSTFPRTHYFWL